MVTHCRWLAAAAASCLAALAAAQAPSVPPAFANTADAVPPGWTGPVFQMSTDFPAAAPVNDPMPWKAIDFKTQPEQYIRAVFAYCREGNEEVDWVGQKNAVRKWYHAPGFAKAGTDTAREFVHGLTRERTSPAKELHEQQADAWTNWAVGMYNPIAAYTLGQVWKNPTAPDTGGAKFADGAVGVKLLFTTAPVEEVPFLAGTKEWPANVSQATPGNPRAQGPRSPQTVRLLQVDVAVRDSRADETTGWVFGTFMYQGASGGKSPLDGLVPVGIAWGDDPELTPTMIQGGAKLTQSWINPASKSPHLGWQGRLNGPVDNPKSSCLSCHARAGFPQTGDMVPPNNATDEQRMAFFKNVKAGEPYKPGVKSYDFSLQLGMGVRNFPPPDPTGGPAPPGGAAAADFNPRAGESETESAAATVPARKFAAAPGGGVNWLVVGGVGAAVVLLILIVVWAMRKPAA